MYSVKGLLSVNDQTCWIIQKNFLILNDLLMYVFSNVLCMQKVFLKNKSFPENFFLKSLSS